MGDASEEDDVVNLATRWNRRKEKSLGDSQGRLFNPKQRRILCSSGINMIIGRNDLLSEESLTFR
eukprot:scaffold14255_cov141-Skeletonema_dohrnii-CCMP3373.AAC.2